mgnify:CR=1 FL=1
MVAIREAIIPASNGNRPGQAMVPAYITIHETANTSRGANAEMHRRFLVNGGGDEGVSFHWCVDDKEAVHLIPDDEIAWHAGDGGGGTGNRRSIAIETCVNVDGDWAKTLTNLADLVVVLLKRHNIPLANVVQHNRWSGKNCPTNLRKAGAWAALVARIGALAAGAPAGAGHSAPNSPPRDAGFPGALNAKGETVIGGVNFGGTAVAVEEVTVRVRNAAGVRYERTWAAHELQPWALR